MGKKILKYNYFNSLNKNLLSLVEKGKFKLNQFKASDKKNEESGRIILEALSFIYAGYFCSEKPRLKKGFCRM